MASIYKRGRVWYIAYMETGKQVYKSLKTADEKLARFLKKEFEVKLRRNEVKTEKRISVEVFCKEYDQDVIYRKKSTNTADSCRVREFLAAHGKKTINSINREDIRSFLHRFESKSPKTYNEAIGIIKRFFRPAVERGYILKNPAEGFHRRKVPQTLPRFLTDEEYQPLEDLSLVEGIFPMVVTARYTGLRLAELLHLEWQDFDWERKLVRVLNKPKYEHTVKNYQVRVVPISEELRDKLLPYIREEGICFPCPSGGPYKHEGPRRSLRRIIDDSKLREGRRMGWHDFRHTFASRLAQQGVSLYKICKWLGHSDFKTTQIYAHFAPVYDNDIEKLTIVPAEASRIQ
ncbi:MAG: tyrosine-type recombinase/integrase [Deltaproteobacteria bacterium]